MKITSATFRGFYPRFYSFATKIERNFLFLIPYPINTHKTYPIKNSNFSTTKIMDDEERSSSLVGQQFLREFSISAEMAEMFFFFIYRLII